LLHRASGPLNRAGTSFAAASQPIGSMSIERTRWHHL
jgi:hypothetical protein